MPPPVFADRPEFELFEEIVRAARKEHLKLTLRVVRQPQAGIAMLVVSGSAYAAGYRQGASWPERFRSHLESGLFG